MAIQNITTEIKHKLIGVSADVATLPKYNAGSTFYAVDTKVAYICDGTNWFLL